MDDKYIDIKLLFKAYRIDVLKIEWIKRNVAEVSITEGNILTFSNFWWSDEENINYYIDLKTKRDNT